VPQATVGARYKRQECSAPDFALDSDEDATHTATLASYEWVQRWPMQLACLFTAIITC
jgi:hypothetical protein